MANNVPVYLSSPALDPTAPYSLLLLPLRACRLLRRRAASGTFCYLGSSSSHGDAYYIRGVARTGHALLGDEGVTCTLSAKLSYLIISAPHRSLMCVDSSGWSHVTEIVCRCRDMVHRSLHRPLCSRPAAHRLMSMHVQTEVHVRESSVLLLIYITGTTRHVFSTLQRASGLLCTFHHVTSQCGCDFRRRRSLQCHGSLASSRTAYASVES
jgi:hypothetical protein